MRAGLLWMHRSREILENPKFSSGNSEFNQKFFAMDVLLEICRMSMENLVYDLEFCLDMLLE